MSESGQFWWSLKHNRVETGKDLSPAKDRLGPYPTAAEAERALQTVARRNDIADAEDRRWGKD
jgi:hypothetical protein